MHFPDSLSCRSRDLISFPVLDNLCSPVNVELSLAYICDNIQYDLISSLLRLVLNKRVVVSSKVGALMVAVEERPEMLLECVIVDVELPRLRIA